ncbi:hypothetical protein [Streptomyces sp. NPDC047009]|uniref:hypothetical protein n=1 Tax=Streptomyces sp. NPDC047009 TaxID=3154496 RepID=UPI0033EA2C55
MAEASPSAPSVRSCTDGGAPLIERTLGIAQFRGTMVPVVATGTGRDESRDNLIARIAEAEREGWLGEVEGLQVSLAGAEDKLVQIDRRSQQRTVVGLGIPMSRSDGQ